MRLSEYQEAIKPSMAYSPKADPVGYHALALGGEVGELCNKLKKVERGDFTLSSIADDLIGELGGVCWYITALCNDLGINAENAWTLPPKMLMQTQCCGLQLVRAAGVIADVVLNGGPLNAVVTMQSFRIYSYSAMIAWHIGGPELSLQDVLQANFDLITDRHARGVVHGKGDHR